MKKQIIVLCSLALLSCEGISDVEKEVGATKGDKWISEVLEYAPAPGQFINGGMGNMEAAKKLVGGKSIVSLGGFGGRIVFRFKNDVENGVGDDFVILGNAYPDALYPECSSSEPGIVSVSYDENGNGKADDAWYELRGANDGDKDVVKDYEITYLCPSNLTDLANIEWTDNKSGKGTVDVSELEGVHKGTIYPLDEFFTGGIPKSLTFKGTRIANNGEQTKADLQYWKLHALGNGYADNYSADYTTMVAGDSDTKDSNKFDIANAIDENGNSVKLEKITFIKVYSAVFQTCGWLGETSTEVCGAISLRLQKK
ncbi:MAG: hypothetical protein RR908_02050 [Rikenellaceae bacterium]